MRDSISVQKVDGVAEVVGHLSRVVYRIAAKGVVLQKLEHTLTKHLKGNTHVSVVVEPIQHGDAQVLAPGVVLVELVENIDLQLGGVLVLGDVLDDLEGDHPVLVNVVALDDLAKGSLAEDLHEPVSVLDEVAVLEDEVVFFVDLHHGTSRDVVISKEVLQPKVAKYRGGENCVFKICIDAPCRLI